jgi:hypothetical protein
MSANPTITIFNANPLAVQISVNNGPQFSVAAAAATTWIPSSPTSGGPTWSNSAPGQNVISPGDNYLSITPTGKIQPFTTTVSIPGTFQWDSLQLYIYFNSYSDVSWIVLNGGQFVTGNLKLGSSAVFADA